LFHAGSAPGVCSLQSLAPLVQPYAVSDAVALSPLPRTHHNAADHRIAASHPGHEDPSTRHLIEDDNQRNRGSASRLCSTRESASSTGGLDRCSRVALLGFRPLQGLLPRRDGLASTRASPHAVGTQCARRSTEHPTTGCHSRRGWLVSRETTYPPGVPYLLTLTIVRLCRGPGIASSVAEVRSRPLARPLWAIFRAYRSRLCAACR
jgi:hypothetical protein